MRFVAIPVALSLVAVAATQPIRGLPADPAPVVFTKSKLAVRNAKGDRLLGTYLGQPAKGHKGMSIGLEDFRDACWQTLPRILAMPFNRRAVKGARCGRVKMGDEH